MLHRENKFIVEKKKERRIVLARSNRSRSDFVDEYWQGYVIEFGHFYHPFSSYREKSKQKNLHLLFTYIIIYLFI